MHFLFFLMGYTHYYLQHILKITMNKSPILILSGLLIFSLAGCSKKSPPSFDQLDAILAPTETSLQERNIRWYQDQKIIRGNVLAACFDYFTDQSINPDGTYDYEYLNNMYAMYAEIPDCQNARTADISANQDQTLVYEHQINRMDNSLNTPTAQAEIQAAALAVAQHLEASKERNQEIDQRGKLLIDQITEQPAE